MNTKNLITVSACLLFFNDPVYAQNDLVQDSPAALLLQTFFGLIIVVVAIFAFAWLAKKLQTQSLGRFKNMELLSVLPLGPKEKAVLVQVKGKSLLLGVAPGRVSALHVFEVDGDVSQGGGSSSSTESNDCASDTACVSQTKALSARTTSEFSQKLQSFLGQGK